jgi:hypothetical protein
MPQPHSEQSQDGDLGGDEGHTQEEVTTSADIFGGAHPIRIEHVDDHIIGVPLVSLVTRKGDAPVVRLVWDVIDGVFQCREVAFVADHTGGRDVRQIDLRSLSIEKVKGQVFEQWAQSESVDLEEYELRVVADPLGGDRWARRRALDRSRGTVTRELLERVARIYRENPKAPTKAVKEAFDVSHRTAGNYVERARKADLLPPPAGRRS